MIAAIRDGLRAALRSFGLVLLLLLVNLLVAALLAVPLAGTLHQDLQQKDAAGTMMYGFDFAWWSQWSETPRGFATTFGPELLGVGFAFRNLELLLQGNLPAGLLRGKTGDRDARDRLGVDPVILAVGVLYLFIQTFLVGGILGVLRSDQGSWTVRGLLHGSGFYFGRMLRVALLVLVADWALFALNAPFGRWAERQAMEAVSERTALVWLLGRQALLLLALMFVNMLSSYAKVIVVLEERGSAVLALLSALAFCAGKVLRTFGHYLAMFGLGVLLLAVFALIDRAWHVTGYKTQLVALVLMEGFVLGRIALRLSLLGGQMSLYRRETPGL